MSPLMTVHDPRGYAPQVSAKRMAPRLQSLAGKTVYLVDCLFENSDVFMQQLQLWFGKHIPSAKTHIIKPRESWVDDPEMRQRIVNEADAAVFGVGL